MSDNNAAIQALREALEITPENARLRRHLAEMLLEAERFDEAEGEFRIALRHAPHDAAIMLGLANTFHAQGKNNVALAVLEDRLFKEDDIPGEAHLLYARILLAVGRTDEAAEAYQEAILSDPDLEDPDLEESLGVTEEAPADEDEAFDPRLRATIDEEVEEPVPAEVEKPSTDFSSVGGMEKVKEEIQLKIILPLTNKDLYAAYGKTMGGGILLYGPPGCGKTHLARAVAGEIKGAFMAVGLHDVLDMYIGQSEEKLHRIFERARRSKPCVLFFDEVDALGASRSDMRRTAGRHLINQFLSELDGINANNEGVLILAATNAPWHLDSAFRRPGRFDRIIFVPPPDAPARKAIAELLLKGKPLESIDYGKVAKKTDGFSGADLKAVVDVAVEDALREALKKGKPAPISTSALLKAAKSLKPSTTDWFASARNYALYANEGGLYDEILEYLKTR